MCNFAITINNFYQTIFLDDMKKSVLSMIVLAVSLQTMADPVSLSQARQMAAQLGLAETDASLVVNSQAASRLKRAPLGDQSTLPYYIFSRGQGKGFVIMSGDDCLPQVLGYTESGDFDEAKMPPALKDWLAQYAVMIEEAQKSGQNMPQRIRQAASQTAVARHDIPALVQTHWHQESPYNDKCPYMKQGGSRAMTGCVATAAAQVVYFFHKDLPDTLMATTPTYSYGGAPVTESFAKGTPIKWGLMQPKYGGSEPAAFKESVATFMAALGAATWLTYGTSDTDRSTSGQISNLVNTFSSCFNLSSVCKYKSGMSQTAWEDLIYADLAAGCPIVYSGVHPSNGGHAVVVDGYQTKTNLFHFNFGWGGQGDGWYTVNDETGMNGFSQQQGMVYNVRPKHQNVKAVMQPVATAAKGRVNDLKVKVTNDGSVDFTGLYVFASTNGTLPKNVSSAVGKDLATVIVPGEERTVDFAYTPKTVGKNYLTVTDRNLNILAQDTVDVADRACRLSLNKIRICGSADSETAEGHSYDVVYNNTAAACEIEVANPSDINFSDYISLCIDRSTDGGKTFENIGKARTKLTVAAGDTAVATATFSNTATVPVVPGSYYKVYVQNPLSSTNKEDFMDCGDGQDEARFIIKPGTLEATMNADNICVFTGDWDEHQFTTLASRSANAKAVAYDLTAVKGISHVPETKNPNALVYVADDAGVTGYNVVGMAANTCKQLRLTVGNDFRPQQTFTASHTTLTVNQTPGRWYLLTVPVRMTVPAGMMARSVNGHTTQGITGKTDDVTVLEPGHTYLLKTSAADCQTLTGGESEVCVAPAANADANVRGCYAADRIEGAAYLVDAETGYFETAPDGATAEALRGYFVKDNTITATRFTADTKTTLDPEYATLAETITSCKGLLENYRDLVKEEAYSRFAAVIAEAEQAYTAQSMTLKYQVTDRVTTLKNAAATYQQQLKEGQDRLDIDFTAALANPSFEKGNMSGWNAGSSVKSVKPASSLTYTGVGFDGNYLAYCSAKTEKASTIHQDVKGLLPGTYTLTAKLGTKDDYTVTMYAADKEVTVGVHPFGEYYLTEARIEGIEVGADSTLTLGIRPCLWYKADDFRLTCTATSGQVNAIHSVRTAGGQAAPVLVRVDNGTLVLTTTAPQPVVVTNLYGMVVWRQTLDGTERIQLPHGLYIVGRQKVLVR